MAFAQANMSVLEEWTAACNCRVSQVFLRMQAANAAALARSLCQMEPHGRFYHA